MDFEAKTVDIEPAISDLRNRTLSRLPCDFSRLVYLASSRDYNTGRYYHDGLAFHFSDDVVDKAFAVCHEEIFGRLVFCSFEELVEDLQHYVSSTEEKPEDLLKSWNHFESYRITIPSQCDELAAGLFCSNVRIALALLQIRRNVASQDEQFA